MKKVSNKVITLIEPKEDDLISFEESKEEYDKIFIGENAVINGTNEHITFLTSTRDDNTNISHEKLNFTPKEDEVLGEKEGVILDIKNGLVEVEFDEEIIASLPECLFQDSSKIKMGQRFKYLIMKRENDFRYEKIDYITIEKEGLYYKKFKELFEGSEFE